MSRKNSSLKNVRVLLVDDEKDLTNTLRVGMRRRTGWTVEEANSGEEALELLENARFDVIVSDERMPGLQGSDLLTIARHRWPETIRITLSGQASLERAIHAINAADVHRFLLKPCDRDEIVATIEELLHARKHIAGRNAERKQLQAAPRENVDQKLSAALSSAWVAYQPIFDCGGSVLAHEALLRTGSTALPTPEALLQAAEESGRMAEINAIMREKVAEAAGRAPVGTSILLRLRMCDLLDESLYDLSSPLCRVASRVILELAGQREGEEARELPEYVSRLSSMGFLIALDDVAASASDRDSLSVLNAKFVRFDPAAVRNIDRSPTKRAIVGALSNLCRSRGIRTIANGVESEYERDALQDLGCDFIQGQFLAAPEREFWSGTRGHAA